MQASSGGAIRTFIAVDLNAEVRDKLQQVMQALQQQLADLPLRWVPVENIHLTLKFLGDVSPRNLELVKSMLDGEVSLHRPFEFGVGTLGAFPHERHPRVLWVGVQGPRALSDLYEGIETAMARLGYPRERRPFTPHLTLARVARNASAEAIRQIREVLRSSNLGYLGSVYVEEVHLYRSDLRPQGPKYTRLYTATLRGDVSVVS
ncbi:MAG: RNA 2',3'-cyclic phosphodiesterase [Chloroflexi bacterium]|nr:RNA 2',3'-cyclic phosphodiesterase [Chloroflexota bacterium]